MKVYRIYTVNKKAVKILQRFNNTTLVQFIKSGKQSTVNSNYIKYFDNYWKSNIQQLKLEL
jgi:hypothetical protein